METEAVFDGIATRISYEVRKAKKSIFIAVAWFTNNSLFQDLVTKANNGCEVLLITSDDDINRNANIDFNTLVVGNSKIYRIGNGDSKLMHNKFCVIDLNTVITGSYNWSNKAETNHENIIITKGDSALALQFIEEFIRIRDLYYPNEPTLRDIFPLARIIQRLEILKNYILLEDLEEIKKEVAKLHVYSFNDEIQNIIDEIENNSLSSAIRKILLFISSNQQLVMWVDPEIAALKLEAKNLENQVNAFDNEKVELEKLLASFQHRHTRELSTLILQILNLRKENSKNDPLKYEEAINDEEQYQEQVKEELAKDLFELNEEEEQELKKQFRKATTLCHPDKFANESIEIQRRAEEIFKELNEANAKNDLIKVSEILKELELNMLSTKRGLGLTDKEMLRNTCYRLKQKLEKIQRELLVIKSSEVFKVVKNITDWDIYFKETKERLQLELTELSKGLKI